MTNCESESEEEINHIFSHYADHQSVHETGILGNGGGCCGCSRGGNGWGGNAFGGGSGCALVVLQNRVVHR